MKDLATFIVVNLDQNEEVPDELMRVLKKNGWMVVREHSIFVLPWERIVAEDGEEARELLTRIEEVRTTLRKLKIRYVIKTLGPKDQAKSLET
ncbi:MAG: hypothetical protein ACE5KV_01165 [Thermoplasmata archaeon]